jgi:hypothetical protein
MHVIGHISYQIEVFSNIHSLVPVIFLGPNTNYRDIISTFPHTTTTRIHGVLGKQFEQLYFTMHGYCCRGSDFPSICCYHPVSFPPKSVHPSDLFVSVACQCVSICEACPWSNIEAAIDYAEELIPAK